MIIIGEKINGAIPSVAAAIADRDAGFIRDRASAQSAAGAQYIDCAPGTAPELEYDAMVWLLDCIQSVTDTPVCIDSPDASLLVRVLEEGLVRRPGMVNSVNEESDKCERIFPLIAGTDWSVIGLTCDADGIPTTTEKKLTIAKRIIDKADAFGVRPGQLHIDPCIMALAAFPESMRQLEECIAGIHEYAPEVRVTGAISNVSYMMPARKYVNLGCAAYVVRAGLDSAILDPCSTDLMSVIAACEALCMQDKCGRRYNRLYRQGRIGGRK